MGPPALTQTSQPSAGFGDSGVLLVCSCVLLVCHVDSKGWMKQIFGKLLDSLSGAVFPPWIFFLSFLSSVTQLSNREFLALPNFLGDLPNWIVVNTQRISSLPCGVSCMALSPISRHKSDLCQR